MAIDLNLEKRKRFGKIMAFTALAIALFLFFVVGGDIGQRGVVIGMVFFLVTYPFYCAMHPRGVLIVPEPGDVGYEEWLAEQEKQ